MIELRIVEGDLLESSAEALMLPTDGLLPGNAGSSLIARSLGHIARSFARRYSECELVEEIDAQVTFPLPLGRAAHVELSAGSQFRFALLLSLLPHHSDQTDQETMRAAAASAFAQALGLCDALGMGSVATPLLKGGWRISSSVAMTVMLQTLANARVRHPLAVEVRIMDEPSTATAMRELARTFGFGTG
jgi:hypothetical protein